MYSVYLSLHDLPANTDDICPGMSSYPLAIVSSLTASASFRCRREWRISLSRPGSEFQTYNHNSNNLHSDIYSVDGWMDHLRKNKLVGWDEKWQCKNLCLLAIYRTCFLFFRDGCDSCLLATLRKTYEPIYKTLHNRSEMTLGTIDNHGGANGGQTFKSC